MWNAEIPIYEGETLEALRSEYVATSVKFGGLRSDGGRFAEYDICKYIFRNKQSPERAVQAAQVWANDLDLIDRIRSETFNTNVAVAVASQPTEISDDDVIKGLWEIATTSGEEGKDRVAAYSKILDYRLKRKALETPGGNDNNPTNVYDAWKKFAEEAPN